MFKRIDHVEIAPSDLERTIAFYQEVIGFTVRSRQTIGFPPLREIVYMTLGDTMIELLGYYTPVTTPTDPSQIGYRMMALEVDDMEQTIAELATKGVAVTWGPMNLADSIRAEIHDPDGLTIELREWCK
jgi:glyoxylase I family protein